MFSTIALSLIVTYFVQSASCISKCPDIKPVENFDIAAYGSNSWYQIARYSNPYLTIDKCVTLKTTFDGNVVQAKILNIPLSIPQFLESNVTFAPDAQGSGKLIASSIYGVSRTAVDIPLEVLSIDYERYAIFYTCAFDEVTKTVIDYVWIIGRSKSLEESEKAVLAKFVKSEIIDENKLIWTDNSDESCKLP